MNKANYLLKNMAVLTISNFASKILVFLLVPLYTSVLNTAEYGSYDLAVSTATLCYPILTLNIVDAVMRFSMDREYSENKVVSIGFKYVTGGIVIFGIGMIVFNRFSLWPDVSGLELWMFLYYLFYTLNQFLIQFAKGLEKVMDMAFAGVINTVVTIAANVLFLIVFKWGLEGFFIANIAALSFSVLYLAVRLRIWKYLRLFYKDRELTREMFVYCIPLVASTIGWWINSASDKYVVSFMIGVAANGLLSVAYKIPTILNTLQSIFIQAWQISAIKEYGNNDTAKFYGKTFDIINVMMCAACSWLIVLTRPLASFLYANDFFTAWQYVPFLLVSSVFNCASGLLGPILSAQKKSKDMMWSALIGAGANVIMNIVFAYFIGIQGTTIATVISSYMIYLVRKRGVGKNIELSNYIVTLMTWFLILAQAVIEIYLQSYIFEVVIMVALTVINWASLENILKLVKSLLVNAGQKFHHNF